MKEFANKFLLKAKVILDKFNFLEIENIEFSNVVDLITTVDNVELRLTIDVIIPLYVKLEK